LDLLFVKARPAEDERKDPYRKESSSDAEQSDVFVSGRVVKLGTSKKEGEGTGQPPQSSDALTSASCQKGSRRVKREGEMGGKRTLPILYWQ